jgi:DNA-binding Lrp family transcriptional regulator
MDSLSLKLLHLLENDATLNTDQMATMLGETVEAVAGRIDDLEKSRVILRRKAIINWERTGEDTVVALIEVRVVPQRDVGFSAIASRIARFPEARSVSLVSGTYDLAVEIVGRSMKDVASFVSEKLAPLDGVQGTTTHFLLRRYKLDGEMFDEAVPTARLPFAP